MGNKNVTKRQHYVPQFYLKYFTNEDGIIQALDIKNNRLGSPKPCSALGYSHYFYAVETGIPDDVSQQVEKWLQQFESAIACELPDIINKILNGAHINVDDRYILAVLMSMLWLRSPNMRTQLNQIEEDMIKKIMSFYAPERIDRYIKKTEKKISDKERRKFIKAMEEGSYKLRFNNAQHLRFMTKTLGFGGPGFANMFFGQKWKIYIARGKKRFITSDSPVIEWWPPPKTFHGASFLERNKYFTLTPEIFLELTYPIGSEKAKRKTIFDNEDDTVSLFNILIAAHSHAFAYSGDKKNLESLLAGRKSPGILEKAYYERYERPWKESRKIGRTRLTGNRVQRDTRKEARKI